MRLYYTDQFVLPLPDGHTFPMSKYRLLRERVLASGLVSPDSLIVPNAATDSQLALAHDTDYIAAMSAGTVGEQAMKRIGFPWSPLLVERSRRSAGATTQACRSALADGYSVNLAGGTHHAFQDHGEGYCLFNDSVIASRVLQSEDLIRRVVVIDLDVHQGNGTAAICRDDPSIYTFSMHGAKNYPLQKEQSDLDIELPDGTTDEPYLEALAKGLRQSINKARPNLAIFLAGSDPFEGDRLGRLKLTKTGLAERDRMVFEAVRVAGLPLVVTMAGGYAKDVNDTVDIHWQTVRQAIEAAS
ncbi:histone deacetylase family protein [Zavarzinella formosa]|uniref:histone deacetylase family protein n=1 Tax=Zavarzinella formosa TaxID=360055 RepID=UPI00036B13C5